MSIQFNTHIPQSFQIEGTLSIERLINICESYAPTSRNDMEPWKENQAGCQEKSHVGQSVYIAIKRCVALANHLLILAIQR